MVKKETGTKKNNITSKKKKTVKIEDNIILNKDKDNKSKLVTKKVESNHKTNNKNKTKKIVDTKVKEVISKNAKKDNKPKIRKTKGNTNKKQVNIKINTKSGENNDIILKKDINLDKVEKKEVSSKITNKLPKENKVITRDKVSKKVTNKVNVLGKIKNKLSNIKLNKHKDVPSKITNKLSKENKVITKDKVISINDVKDDLINKEVVKKNKVKKKINPIKFLIYLIIYFIAIFGIGYYIGMIPFLKSDKDGILIDKVECKYTEWITEEVSYSLNNNKGELFEGEYIKYTHKDGKHFKHIRSKECKK